MRQSGREKIFIERTLRPLPALAFLAVFLLFSAIPAGAAWLGPTNAPPLDNVPAPLNQGTIFGGQISGTYSNLKISVSPCSLGQVLTLQAVGGANQIVCADAASNATLLAVLNSGANAGGYAGGVVIGSSAATWLNLGGAFTASWIHATSSGNNSIFGNLTIGDNAGNPALLNISDSSQNPELQLQYGAGAADHWGIYADHGNGNSLNIWSDNGGAAGNRLTLLRNGNVGIGAAAPTNRLQVAGGITLENVAPAAKSLTLYNQSGNLYWDGKPLKTAVYKGLSTASSNGESAGYRGANAKCAATFSGSHVCTVGEMLDSINYDITLPASGSYWLSNGTPEITQSKNDCHGWTSAAGSNYGVVWIFNATGGQSGLRQCSASNKFLCCQ